MHETNTKLKVSTYTTPSLVVQVRDILGEISYHYADLCAAEMDAAIRAKLIELGWTPPEEKA